MAGLLESILSNLFLNAKGRDAQTLFNQYQNDAMIPKSVDITPQGTNPKNFDYNTLTRMPTAADLAPYYARALALGQDPTGQMKLQEFQDQSRSDARSLNAQRQPLADILAAFKPGQQSISSPTSNANPAPMSGQVSTPANPTLQTILPQLLKLYQAGGDTKPIESLFKTAQGEPYTLNQGDVRYGANNQPIAGAPPKPENMRQPPVGYQLAPDGKSLVPIPGGPDDPAVRKALAGATAGGEGDTEGKIKARIANKMLRGEKLSDQEQSVWNQLNPSGAIDPELMQPQAQAIANYKQPAPSARFAARPEGMALMNEVLKLNPDYNAVNFDKFKQGQINYNSGKPGGQRIQALNRVAQHINTLKDLGTALNSGDVQLVNRARQAFQNQFGAAAPNNFSLAAKIAGPEIAKTILGSGVGSQEERQALSNSFQQTGSPSQIVGAAITAEKFIAGQVNAEEKTYIGSTGDKTGFSGLLLPEAQKLWSLYGQAGAGGQSAPSGQAPSGGFKYLGRE